MKRGFLLPIYQTQFCMQVMSSRAWKRFAKCYWEWVVVILEQLLKETSLVQAKGEGCTCPRWYAGEQVKV